MITIVYASRASLTMGDDALFGLLEASRSRNVSVGVTGMLIYAFGSFMQQLEGEDDAVDAIYASIAADPRHRDLRLLGRREVAGRRFGSWSMAFEHLDTDALVERLPGYRTNVGCPLVSSELVTSFEIAESVLAAAGDSPAVNAL